VVGDALGNVDLLKHEQGFTMKGAVDWLGDEEMEGVRDPGDMGYERTSLDSNDREYPLMRALPVCVARRVYYPDRRAWSSRTEAICSRCGFLFRVPATSLAASTTLRKSAQRFGWKSSNLHDAKLQVRCSRCRKLHRLSPLVISTVSSSTASGKPSWFIASLVLSWAKILGIATGEGKGLG